MIEGLNRPFEQEIAGALRLTPLRKRPSSAPIGVCPSIGADRVMGAVGSDTRRRARSRCHSTSSVRNKGDGLLVVPALSSFQAGQQKTAHNPKGTGGLWPISLARPARSSRLHNKISLSRAVADGGHRRPSLFASSTHKTFVTQLGKSLRDRDNKTPVRDRTPILGHTPGEFGNRLQAPEIREASPGKADFLFGLRCSFVTQACVIMAIG